MYINKLKDYILILENIISSTLCDDILNEYIDPTEWQHALLYGNKMNKEIRNCKTLKISSNEVIKKNEKVRKRLDVDVFQCANRAIKIYNGKFKQANISLDTGYQLLKYEKGGFHTEHVDSYTNTPRTISCSFILNDNFKGGEFSFFNNKIIYPLKKGSAILFPSNFIYPHSVLPVINGTRYSIVTWFI